MKNEEIDTIEIRTNIIMTTTSLEVIVDLTKKFAQKNSKGYYTVDTAGAVGHMVSRFLLENDFESFVQDERNYPPFG